MTGCDGLTIRCQFMKNNTRMFTVPLMLLSLGFVLQGCGSDKKETAPPPAPAAAFVPGTYPRFDPVVSDLPFNTDFIFAKAATTDGTADVGAATDAVRSALNVMDGFSTSAYFDVMIQGSVNPATVLPMQTVFLVEVNTNGKDALNPANIIGLVAPTGPATFDAKVVSLDGGTNNVVRIRPTSPLKSKTKYLVFLTNDIKDAAGASLTRSWTYNALHDASYATLDSLLPVRNAILGWEQLAGGFLAAVSSTTSAAAIDKLVLTYTFTTTDPQTPLIAMASPRAVVASLQIAAGIAPATAVSNAVALDAGGVLSTPKKRPLNISPATGIDFTTLSAGALVGSVGKLYTGYIKLPYYQTAPGDLPFGAYLTKNWTPNIALATALGKTVPADVSGAFNVTYRYPFAAKTSDETIPLQVTLPEKDLVPGFVSAPSATCNQIFGSSGYPVAIYIHGITSDRTSALALAHTLASKCIATVAIDLPLHGVPANSAFVNALNVENSQIIPFSSLYGANAPHERHFNVAGPGGAPAPMNFDAPTASDGSGAQFTNLGYLANTRDNNREAVIDLLNLNASLQGINDDFLTGLGVSLDLNKVYVVGVSLGGIIGTTFTAVNQAAIANDALVGLPSGLNPIRGIVLASAGSQVAQIMINSPTFGPVINGGLAASGVKVGTSNYEKFVYAAQSTLDSADAVSFAQTLAAQGVPVLLQQIKNDQVIPNYVSSAPLAGTEALARLLGATTLGLGETQLGSGYVKMSEGDHVSLLRPAANTALQLQVTTELQTQVVTFILNAGKVAVGAAAPENIEVPLVF